MAVLFQLSLKLEACCFVFQNTVLFVLTKLTKKSEIEKKSLLDKFGLKIGTEYYVLIK